MSELANQPSLDPLEDISAPDIFEQDGQTVQLTPKSSQTKANTTTTKLVLHRVVLQGFQFEWLDQENIWMSRDPGQQGWTGFVYAAALRRGRNKLIRGYPEPAEPFDDFKPIKHVVFMVHGVGQFRDSRKIIRNTKLPSKEGKIIKEQQ